MNSFFKITCVVFFLVAAFDLGAQQNFVTVGTEATGASGTVSYSIGQVDYIYLQSATHNINEGVQQPYEFFTLYVSEPVWDIGASVFPNPAINEIFLEIKETLKDGMCYSLYDEQGKLIVSQFVTSSKTIISMTQLARAVYLLEVKYNEQKIAGFKIIKH
jgi:hypothetical protein